ncbi:hypothetical protein MKX03_006592 [Papaver bracteatum]|nr:hypothetical protein MKX03_006592 [Papaver bracteatum]
MTIAQVVKSEFADKDYSLPGIRGVGTGWDADEFILIGANIYSSVKHLDMEREARHQCILHELHCIKQHRYTMVCELIRENPYAPMSLARLFLYHLS